MKYSLFTLIVILPLFFLSIKPVYTNKNKILKKDSNELTDLKNIVFATDITDWLGLHIDSLSMDIYYPAGATTEKKYPVVILCHAGDFTGGNKTNESSLCDELADYGYITVAPNYRTGYNKTGTENCTKDTATLVNAVYRAMQDCDACLRFIKAYGDNYNMDTSKMFLAGNSSGATVILNAAYTNDSVAKIYFPKQNLKLGSLDSSGNVLPNNYTLKGICGMWGSIFSDKVMDTNYRCYPTLFFKGDDDVTLPDSSGYLFDCPKSRVVFSGVAIYDRLLLEKTQAVYYILLNAGHGAYDEDFCVENMACFFRDLIIKKYYSGMYFNYTPSCPQFQGEF